jgi:hypothetical protein
LWKLDSSIVKIPRIQTDSEKHLNSLIQLILYHTLTDFLNQNIYFSLSLYFTQMPPLHVPPSVAWFQLGGADTGWRRPSRALERQTIILPINDMIETQTASWSVCGDSDQLWIPPKAMHTINERLPTTFLSSKSQYIFYEYKFQIQIPSSHIGRIRIHYVLRILHFLRLPRRYRHAQNINS